MPKAAFEFEQRRDEPSCDAVNARAVEYRADVREQHDARVLVEATGANRDSPPHVGWAVLVLLRLSAAAMTAGRSFPAQRMRSEQLDKLGACALGFVLIGRAEHCKQLTDAATNFWRRQVHLSRPSSKPTIDTRLRSQRVTAPPA